MDRGFDHRSVAEVDAIKHPDREVQRPVWKPRGGKTIGA
jgi:hypothetical protein